jgi:hypothetical protein
MCVLIGTSWENPLTWIAVQTELRRFSEAQAQRRSYSGVFPQAGTLKPFMCRDCGRIFLYGLTKEQRNEE